jgi:predicted ArsR family transcriptional regulator
MSEMSRVRLTDPLALRAYAHPLRMRLVVLLRLHGPHTATQAAQALGDTVPNCSFHLRQLAKYGLVERAEGADRRERPWQATALATSWDDEDSDPETRAAADHLSGVIVARQAEMTQAWLRVREQETPAWRRATGIGDHTVHVTADELDALMDRITAILSEYDDRQTDPSRRPAGTRAINVAYTVVPWDMP